MALGKTVAQVTLPTLLWKWSSLLGLPLKGEDVELIRGGFQLGKWGYPNNGWLLLGEIPLKWMIYDDLGVPHLWKPPYTINGWYKTIPKTAGSWHCFTQDAGAYGTSKAGSSVEEDVISGFHGEPPPQLVDTKAVVAQTHCCQPQYFSLLMVLASVVRGQESL